MKSKYFRIACILIGILFAGGIALLISLAVLWGTGGYGWLVFAVIYVVGAVLAGSLAVVLLVLSIAKHEPCRWLSMGLLTLVLLVGWRSREIFFQVGAGLVEYFFEPLAARKNIRHRSPRGQATNVRPAARDQSLEIHLVSPLDR